MTMMLFVLIFVCSGIKTLKEWERVAILRLGKFYGIRGPGIYWKMPILDKVAMKVSLRVQSTEIDTSITSPKSTYRWKGIVHWRIVNVEKFILFLENPERTIHTGIQHHVSKEIEFLSSDALFTDREDITANIQSSLEQKFEGWGIKIVEIDLRSV